MKINIVVTDVVNDVTYSRKSIQVIHVWSKTLLLHDVGKQRRTMIKKLATICNALAGNIYQR